MNQWVRPKELHDAAKDAETYGIPSYALKAWRVQRSMAIRRGIPFNFSVQAWHWWWVGQLKAIGPEATRGRRSHQYVMARIGDRGAYELGNVHAILAGDNIREIPEDVKAAAQAKASETMAKLGRPRGTHLRVRGDGHPKAMAVLTPAGRFGSIALASEHYGVTRQCGGQWLARGIWQRATDEVMT